MLLLTFNMRLTIALVIEARIELAGSVLADTRAQEAAKPRLVDESSPTVGTSMDGAPEPEK